MRYVIEGNYFRGGKFRRSEPMPSLSFKSKILNIVRCWYYNKQEAGWSERFGRDSHWYYEVRDTKTNKIIYPGTGEN